MIGCSGVIVFKHDLTQTCLVSTKKRGNLGFPKGKRHGKKKIKKLIEKGKLIDFDISKLKDKSFLGESNLETAFRELEEETGIKEEYVDLVKDKNGESVFIDELSKNGNPCVRYFIGILKKEHKDHQLTFDEDELSCTKWFSTDKVKDLDMLRDNRQEIFKQATSLVSLNTTT